MRCASVLTLPLLDSAAVAQYQPGPSSKSQNRTTLAVHPQVRSPWTNNASEQAIKGPKTQGRQAITGPWLSLAILRYAACADTLSAAATMASTATR